MGLFIDPKREIEYVIKSEREKPEAERTTFRLRALTAREFATFRDRASTRDADGKLETNVFLFDVELLRLALVGWSGKDAPKFPGTDTPESVEAGLDMLSPEVRDELSLEAWKMNRVEDDEGKA